MAAALREIRGVDDVTRRHVLATQWQGRIAGKHDRAGRDVATFEKVLERRHLLERCGADGGEMPHPVFDFRHRSQQAERWRIGRISDVRSPQDERVGIAVGLFPEFGSTAECVEREIEQRERKRIEAGVEMPATATGVLKVALAEFRALQARELRHEQTVVIDQPHVSRALDDHVGRLDVAVRNTVPEQLARDSPQCHA